MTQQVKFMVSCLVDQVRPAIAHASIKLLEEAGATVTVPMDQTCCGQPAFNSGHKKLAQSLACRHDQIFQDDGPENSHIVTPTGSCAGHIKRQFNDLIDSQANSPQNTPPNTPQRTYELSQYLVDVLAWKCPPVRLGHQQSITLIDSCAGLRELGLGHHLRSLLTEAGFAILENDGREECCGFGGAFAVKYDEISSHIGLKKLRHLEKATTDQARKIVTGWDYGCLMHLEGLAKKHALDIEFFHFAELLAGEW